jgi:hypothetical protein
MEVLLKSIDDEKNVDRSLSSCSYKHFSYRILNRKYVKALPECYSVLSLLAGIICIRLPITKAII